MDHEGFHHPLQVAALKGYFTIVKRRGQEVTSRFLRGHLQQRGQGTIRKLMTNHQLLHMIGH
jgi:hypothetical protein